MGTIPKEINIKAIGVRGANVLYKLKIDTVKKFLACSSSDFYRVRGCGMTTVNYLLKEQKRLIKHKDKDFSKDGGTVWEEHNTITVYRLRSDYEPERPRMKIDVRKAGKYAQVVIKHGDFAHHVGLLNRKELLEFTRELISAIDCILDIVEAKDGEGKNTEKETG